MDASLMVPMTSSNKIKLRETHKADGYLYHGKKSSDLLTIRRETSEFLENSKALSTTKWFWVSLTRGLRYSLVPG